MAGKSGGQEKDVDYTMENYLQARHASGGRHPTRFFVAVTGEKRPAARSFSPRYSFVGAK
jgi:hypothetical protein